jgi:hypothetical protein
VARGGTPGHTNLRIVQDPITITQDAKTMTMEHQSQNGTFKLVYNLDGSESKNSIPGRPGGAPTEQMSMAKWNGDKLAVTTKNPNGDRVAMWYLEGGELVSETQGQNGPIKAYWKKS